MKNIKKILLFSTRIPLFGKFANKFIVLYRRFLDLIGEVNTLRWELHELRARVQNTNNLEHDNLTQSVPVGFRKFHSQITELSLKIAVLEKQLELAQLKNKQTEDTLNT